MIYMSIQFWSWIAAIAGAGVYCAGRNMDRFIYLPPSSKVYERRYFHREPVPHFRVDGDTSAPIYVFYHGNATDAYHSRGLIHNNSTQLYIEYPGYSLHPDTSVSTTGILRDVEKLSEWIKNTRQRVHIIGQSIGTGPACYLAYLLRDSSLLSGLDLVTPFTNICGLVGEYVPFGSFIVPNCYPNDYHLSEIISSKGLAIDDIVIHHGTNDEIIPYSHAVNLSKYGTLKTYGGRTHNDIPWYLDDRIHSH